MSNYARHLKDQIDAAAPSVKSEQPTSAVRELAVAVWEEVDFEKSFLSIHGANLLHQLLDKILRPAERKQPDSTLPQRPPPPNQMRRSPMPKRKKPMRNRTPKRAKEERAYNKRVKEWKLENLWCLACHPIWVYSTGMQGRYGGAQPTVDNHHRAGKEGKLLLDESWWLPVCRKCHEWIGAHANIARELNLLAPKNL